MRTDQINPPVSIGWSNLAAAYLRSGHEQEIGDRVFAVPQLPGCVERFRTLSRLDRLSSGNFPLSTLQGSPHSGMDPLLDAGGFPSIQQGSPYPDSRRYRRR